MLTLIIIILGAAFILYTLLGGADFGAGIIETFVRKKGEKTISKAIAPVWEANHVWLILAVVILFTGFPAVYSSISVALHIPLMLILLGIIIRGTAFTFRHYDVKSDASHTYYSILFQFSSFVTPFFLGITLGAMILGRIHFNYSEGFYSMYIEPWLNLFCVGMGVFSICLFGYISAVFLVGETVADRERRTYVMYSRLFMGLTIVTGMLVFGLAELEGHHLLNEFLRSEISITMLTLASLLIPVILFFLRRRTNKSLYLRVAIGIQVTAIMIGWFYIQYPVLVTISNGNHLTFFNTRAPDATLKQLLIALVVGLILVVPGFMYLFKVFKIRTV